MYKKLLNTSISFLKNLKENVYHNKAEKHVEITVEHSVVIICPICSIRFKSSDVEREIDSSGSGDCICPHCDNELTVKYFKATRSKVNNDDYFSDEDIEYIENNDNIIKKEMEEFLKFDQEGELIKNDTLSSLVKDSINDQQHKEDYIDLESDKVSDIDNKFNNFEISSDETFLITDNTFNNDISVLEEQYNVDDIFDENLEYSDEEDYDFEKEDFFLDIEDDEDKDFLSDEESIFKEEYLEDEDILEEDTLQDIAEEGYFSSSDEDISIYSDQNTELEEWGDTLHKFDFEDDTFFDDYDENISTYHTEEVLTSGKISRYNYFYRNASEICDKYNWDIDGVNLITKILMQYGLGFTKPALIQELESSLTYEDLLLAYKIKVIWHNYPEFSDINNKKNSMWILSYSLSWSTAVKISKAFYTSPHTVELERIFISIYEEWQTRREIQQSFLSFKDYVLYRFEAQNDLIDMPYIPLVEDY